jgi:RNA 2',3'-cyclic 3'-phosphodiesterase
LAKPVAAEAAPTTAPTKRLFFALWPNPVLKAAIAGAARTPARAFAGRRVRDESIHMTLLFLGAVAAEAEARLKAAAAAVRVAPFDLVLDRVGGFFRARVLWVAPSQAPPELAALRRQLEAAATAAGLPFDLKPLVPHLTCYRDIRKAPDPAPIEPLRWAVRDFALVQSVAGQYHVVSQWPLQNAPATNVKTVQGTKGTE